jgi:hypothetical protein
MRPRTSERASGRKRRRPPERHDSRVCGGARRHRKTVTPRAGADDRVGCHGLAKAVANGDAATNPVQPAHLAAGQHLSAAGSQFAGQRAGHGAEVHDPGVRRVQGPDARRVWLELGQLIRADAPQALDAVRPARRPDCRRGCAQAPQGCRRGLPRTRGQRELTERSTQPNTPAATGSSPPRTTPEPETAPPHLPDLALPHPPSRGPFNAETTACQQTFPVRTS